MILDTEFLIGIGEESEAAIAKAGQLEELGVPLRVPCMAVYELFLSVGIGDFPSQNRLEIEAVIANKPIVGVTESIAKRAGVIEGELQASDQKAHIGPVDAVIAATGIEYSEPVVSNDISDFDQVDGLTVESY